MLNFFIIIIVFLLYKFLWKFVEEYIWRLTFWICTSYPRNKDLLIPSTITNVYIDTITDLREEIRNNLNLYYYVCNYNLTKIVNFIVDNKDTLLISRVNLIVLQLYGNSVITIHIKNNEDMNNRYLQIDISRLQTQTTTYPILFLLSFLLVTLYFTTW